MDRTHFLLINCYVASSLPKFSSELVNVSSPLGLGRWSKALADFCDDHTPTVANFRLTNMMSLEGSWDSRLSLSHASWP